MCSNHDPRGLGWTTIFLFYIEKNPEKKSLEIHLSKPIGKTICNLCKSILRYRVESSLFKWWYPGYIEWVNNGVRKGECFSRKKFDYSRKLKCKNTWYKFTYMHVCWNRSIFNCIDSGQYFGHIRDSKFDVGLYSYKNAVVFKIFFSIAMHVKWIVSVWTIFMVHLITSSNR